MVHTKAGMIVNQINHHHIKSPPHRQLPHQSPPTCHLQHHQFNKIFYEEESPIYQYNHFEDDYERRRRFASPNPNKRSEFLNPDRRYMFPNSIHDKEGEHSNLDKFGILSFDENLDVESTSFGLRKLISCLTQSIFP